MTNPTGNFIHILTFWHRVATRGLKECDTNLSSRQVALMLTVYLGDPPHTIRHLARQLDISKPAVCRAVDALEKEGLIKRKPDPADKRNVLLQRTIKGSVFLCDFAEIIEQEMQSIRVEHREVA
jgi:DNA-binding MarR family transcriptional regulator